MGMAKQRKAEIEQLKANNTTKPVLIVAPLMPDSSTDNKPVAEWMRDENIRADVMVVGKMAHLDAETNRIEVIEVAMMVTRLVTEQEALGALEGWWKMAPKGPKFAAWIPLNDINEMTVSGLDGDRQGLMGLTLAEVLKQTGFADEFHSVMDEFMETGTEAANAMKAIKEEVLSRA